MMKLPNPETIEHYLKGFDYSSRSIGEYWFVKDKYEKLHRMIVLREAGKLDFTPKCPMEQWKAQAAAMGEYLHQLEIKAAYEDIDYDDAYFPAICTTQGD